MCLQSYLLLDGSLLSALLMHYMTAYLKVAYMPRSLQVQHNDIKERNSAISISFLDRYSTVLSTDDDVRNSLFVTYFWCTLSM